MNVSCENPLPNAVPIKLNNQDLLTITNITNININTTITKITITTISTNLNLNLNITITITIILQRWHGAAATVVEANDEEVMNPHCGSTSKDVDDFHL